MYRGFVILGGGLILAACTSTPSWLNMDSLKPEPITETVQFESVPPGAEARTTSGQTCRTPCSLTLPANAPFSVTFNLNGYQPETEQVELISVGDGTTRLRPNPVLVELTAAPPPPKKPAPKPRKPARKPAAKPKPATSAAPAAAPSSAASPWPTPQQAR